MLGPRPSRRQRTLRIFLARAAASAAVLAALSSGFLALRSAQSLLRYAVRYGGETVAASQDRLFGRDYMESIRAVRAQIAAGESLLFIDDSGGRQGWTYFALFHLAPRRLERFGTLAELEDGKFELRLPKRTRFVLLIPGDGSPLRLLDPRDLQKRHYRARQAGS